MQPRIPIAFGITDLDVGGAEKTLVELVLRLDRARWSPSVVCLLHLGHLADRLTEAGVPVESLEMRSSVDFFRCMLRWKEILQEQQPQLLQTFLYHANFMGSVAGPLARVPHLFSGHRVADRRRGVRGLLERWTASRFDCHVCVSREVKEFTQQRTGLPDARFAVIPNGVAVDRFRAADPIDRSSLGIRRDELMVLALGRLDRQKGLDLLLEALAEHRRRTPASASLKLVLVGAGPEESALRSQAEKLGLQAGVQFVGWRPDVERWLAAADGLVLSSRWEGMPNAVLEAMAAGKPVVATDVEGVRDLVRPGETGWLVSAENVSALADALADFAERSDRRRQFAAAAQKLVETQFSYGRMVARYESVWCARLRTGADT